MRNLIFALISTGLLFAAGCGADKLLASKKKVPLHVVFYFARDDNFIEPDWYEVHFLFTHSASRSVRGRYIVRVYGDIHGQGGQDNGTGARGDNYDETEVRRFEPGNADACRLYFVLNNKALTDDMSADEVKKCVNLRVQVEFIVDGTDSDYRSADWKFSLSGGNLIQDP